MARPKSDTREQLIGQLVDLFYEYGYDGTTLALITARTGLGRASIYHHFPGGKDEIAKAVLLKADDWARTHVDALLASALPPRERLMAYLKVIDEVQYRASQLTPANAFGIGNGLERFGAGLRERFVGRTEHLSALLVSCGVSQPVAVRRAWEAKILIEGALVCSRVAGDLSLYRGVMQQLQTQLLAPDDCPGVLPAGQVLPAPSPPQSDEPS
ncbi:TetR/AcrR family transcriptional regulator [Niveibacterium sp. 24ML]|uniref:TetR/AcrR family transcriptional regulator n=1 Tax=Niveibacterium sp. 24ML TaxID=2985512 RepID=UPI0022709363|nr:TetR/AcrR family transcriptional regulator [Niveibacterium sp. 24ML]MCX9155615.1 TetR/AcrR family transcriptional regulator [Niveibacterium sp. 24ML]